MPYNFTDEQITCQNEREWPKFVYAFLATFGLFILLALLRWMFSECCKCCQKDSEEREAEHLIQTGSFLSEIQEWAESITSGANPMGRLLVCFMMVCNIGAMVLYILDVQSGLMEECVSWDQRLTIQIDFALGIIFLLHASLRLMAAETFITFLFSIPSLVDIITLPALFLSVWIQRTWVGFRYFRFFMFVQLPDILVYVRLLEKSSAIRVAQLLSMIVGFLLWGSGVIYVLENQGDFFHDYENAREPGEMRFQDCVYFLCITASTVGYGDFYPVTDLGKIFTVFFISFGISAFASMLPEIIEIMGNQPKYNGAYKVDKQKQFIILCGNITYVTVSNFLDDFFHPAREDVNCEVLILNKMSPDLEFEGLLKRRKTQVQYFQGTMLSTFDLQRVSAERAAAVLVLCDKFSLDPTREDASNIMRVISVKNYSEKTRCIVQLLHYHNKSYLLNIPGWDWKRDDQAVCLNEIKYGMLAQSSLAPGFFTLASNIITASDLKIGKEMPRWKQEYLKTSNKIILGETLSPTFVGMSFQEVAEICYSRLNLVLIAVEARKYEGGEIWINPRNKILTANCIGLFITHSSDAVKRAWFYCRVCHENITKVEDIRKCSCKRLAKARYEYFQNGQDTKRDRDLVGSFSPLKTTDTNKQSPTLALAEMESRPGKMLYDSTGNFHWCPAREFHSTLVTRQEAAEANFSGHIVLAIFAEEDSTALGLRNLVMPLRASNIPYNDLRHVVILGNHSFLMKEWPLLRNLPKISLLEGSPLNRADLRAVNVNLCRTCILLSSKPPDKLEPVLADKEIVMAALNIRSMEFKEDVIEKEIEGEDNEDNRNNSVNILLDLSFVTNIRYLDEHEIHLSDNLELQKTLPFATGMAMARGILDSLMSATYFNASSLRLLRLLVTGGTSFELEKSLAEGAGLTGGQSSQDLEEAKQRVRLEEIKLKESTWNRYAENGALFSELFTAALRENGTLCLAVNRHLEADEYDDDPDDFVRVVLGCPDNDLRLEPDDNIIALVQFDHLKEKTE